MNGTLNRYGIIALQSLAGVAFLCLMDFVAQPVFSDDNFALLLTVLAVLVIAIRWGRIPSIVASVAGGAAFIYFVEPPLRTWHAVEFDEYLVAVALLVVSLACSQLSLNAQRRAAEAMASRIEAERLYAFGRALLRPDSSHALAGTVVEELVRTFDAQGSGFRFDGVESVTLKAGPGAHLISFDEAAPVPYETKTRAGDGVELIPVMLAETRLAVIATLRAAISPLAMRSIATITGVALERVRGQEMILRLARDIQMGFLPRRLPPFANDAKIDLFAFIKPTYDVGGDFYSMSALDDSRLCFSVGDVADKGIPASLFMARTLTALDISVVASPTLTEAITAVNRTLCTNNDSQMFVTLLAAVLDTDTGVVEYCDAGHEPPFVVSAGGGVRMIEKKSGLALGFVAGYEYTAARIQLAPGDALVFYTDGINEAMNENREMFTAARIAQALEGAPAATAEALGTALIDAVHAFVGDAPQSDDLTLLILRYIPTPAELGTSVVTVMEAV